ncbi:MAG: D-alanyl-D-alanine endopeptidase [Pseudomonadota bacterium]
MATKNIKCLNFTFIFFLLTLVYAPGAVALSDSKKYRELTLNSNHAVVVDQATGKVLYAKNADEQKPIASITKLMTAIVTLDAKLPMDQKIRITEDDVDTLRNSRSRLKVGPSHSRRELLQLALMSSENRAASALARSYPGGRAAFIAAMNKKAKELGMANTRFADSTGLDSDNVSTAHDLVKLVQAGFQYPLIRQITTTPSYDLKRGTVLKYKNTNPLFKDRNWQIGLSKTGYIKPAGHCLVMQTEVVEKPLIIVLLDAPGKGTVSADSNRIKRWFASLLNATSKVAVAAEPESETLAASSAATIEQGGAVQTIALPDKVRVKFEPTRPLAIRSE